MKRLNFLSFFAIILLAIGFTSCNTEPIDSTFTDGTDGGGSNAPASFQVRIGADQYQAAATSGAVANNMLTLTATNSTGATFTIVVNAARGEYSTALITYRPNASESGAYTNLSTTGLNGVVKIASYNASTHKVSGTFSFRGYWTNPADNRPSADFVDGVFTNITFTTGSETNPYFKVKIDGQQYTASTNLATVGNGLITVNGFRGTSGEYVSVVIDGITEGQYTDEDAVFVYSPDGGENNSYGTLFSENSAGTVNITEIDTENHTISGTFSFTGYNNAGAHKTFTEGEFNDIPYTDNTTTPADNVFSATVDNTNYTYADTDLIIATAGTATTEFVSLTGVNTSHRIRLSINTDLGPGNYQFSNTANSDAMAYYTDSAGTQYIASTGTLNITSNSLGRIVGTFSYTIIDGAGATHTISSGVLNVEY